MKHQHQTTPSTNDGTVNSYTEEREQKKKILDKLEKFHSDIDIEKLIAQDEGNPMAVVEAPREIIEHFNRGKLLQAFDKVGYFIYQGAAICEVGGKEALIQSLDRSNTLMPDDWIASKKKKAN